MTSRGGWIQEPEPLPGKWIWFGPDYGWRVPPEASAEIYRRWVAAGRPDMVR